MQSNNCQDASGRVAAVIGANLRVRAELLRRIEIADA
jgi:hypothetical protein